MSQTLQRMLHSKKNMSTYFDFFVFSVLKVFFKIDVINILLCNIVCDHVHYLSHIYDDTFYYVTTIENKRHDCGGHVILYVKSFRFYKMYKT